MNKASEQIEVGRVKECSVFLSSAVALRKKKHKSPALKNDWGYKGGNHNKGESKLDPTITPEVSCPVPEAS